MATSAERYCGGEQKWWSQPVSRPPCTPNQQALANYSKLYPGGPIPHNLARALMPRQPYSVAVLSTGGRSPVLVDQDAFVDVFIAAHEVGQRFVCQKRDVGFRIVCPQRPKRRRHQHEVTDVHRIDDENIFVCGSHTRFL